MHVLKLPQDIFRTVWHACEQKPLPEPALELLKPEFFRSDPPAPFSENYVLCLSPDLAFFYPSSSMPGIPNSIQTVMTSVVKLMSGRLRSNGLLSCVHLMPR